MMQRNETLLLDAWARYYGFLFGFDNITIIDNGSDKPEVLETLRKYERLGVTVIYDLNSPDHFFWKGSLITDIFKKLQHLDNYEILLPLDCDEFIAVQNDATVRCDKTSIIKELRQFVGSPHTIAIKAEFRNSRRYQDYFYMLPCNKTGFSRGRLTTMDHGYHTAATETEQLVESRLCYIHFHNKPHLQLIEDSRQKLAALAVDVSSHEAIMSAPHSYHLKEYFSHDEAALLGEIDKRAHVPIPGIRQLIEDLGAHISFAHDLADGEILPIIVPSDFDEAAYLERYPDVASSDMTGLQHYMLFGAQEGRL